MAIQTLNTIKNWFKTNLKPTQSQFWDTWDSFRHKYEKVPVGDVEGVEELISEIIPQIPNINGELNKLTKIEHDSKGNLNLTESNITDTGDNVTINSSTEIDSQVEGKSGLRFRKLKKESKTVSEIVFTQDVMPTAGIDGTAYFPFGNIVKKVNLDKTVTDYYSLPEGCFIQDKIIASPNNGDLFLIYFDGVSSYILVKFDESGILSVLRSSILNYRYLTVDKNDNIYVQEIGSQKILRINTVTQNNIEYYTGNLSLGVLGFDLESNGYFFDYEARNLIYKLNPAGTVSNFATLNFEVGTGCVKPDGSLYVISSYNDEDDKNIYSVNNLGNDINIFASLAYKSFEPYIADNGYLYVHNNNYDNGLVYKISLTGVVSLFGSAGNSPRYMTVTNSGIVYVSNSASYNLIKISPQEVEYLLTLDETGNIILSDKEVAAKSDISGTPNTISKFNSSGNGLQDSFITDDGSKILINEELEIDSKSPGVSGLKFTNLKNDVSALGPININTGITGHMNGSVIDSKGNIYVYQEAGGTGIYKINSFTNDVTHIISLPARTNTLQIANSDNIYFFYFTVDQGSYTNVGCLTRDGNVIDIALRIPGGYQRMILDPDTEDMFFTAGSTSDKIIKVTATGVITDFVVPSTVAPGSTIYCGAVDHDHNLFLGTNNDEIIKVEPNGTPSLFATLDSPASPRFMIVGDDNTIYTANSYSNDIGVLKPNGSVNYIGSIGEGNSFITIDKDGNFLTVGGANNARKLYLTTPDGVSIILGDTAQFTRLPVVNSKNEIFIVNYDAGLQKYVISKKRLLTLDEEGNVVKSDEDISQKWVQSWVPNYINTQTPIVISNSNGSPLSASELNFRYPRAVVGTKVQCMSIAPEAPVIYEKTISGWAYYSVTIIR